VVPALLAPPLSPLSTPARAVEVQDRCAAVWRMLRRWGPAGDEANREAGADWRTWNSGAWAAHRLVLAREGELRQVTCRDARGELPFGNRDQRKPEPGEQGDPRHFPGLSGGSPTQ
jgi:hypothetical protein